MKHFVFTFFLLVSYFIINAQPSFTTSDKETVELLKKGTLVVVVKDLEEKKIKKLSKTPEELKLYKESVTLFNTLIKEAVEKEWDLSKIKFLSEAEAEQLKETKDSNHFLLEITEVKNYKMGDFYSAHNGSNPSEKTAIGQMQLSRERAYHYSPSGESVALSISPASKPNKELVVSYLPVVGLSKGSVIFLILHLKNQLNDCLSGITSAFDLKDDVEKREAELKNKTLLIFDPLISKPLQKIIDKNELSKFYQFPVEIVSFDKVEVVIKEKNANYAYLWVVPAGIVNQGKVLFNYFIIDAKDSRILFLLGSSFSGANGEFHQGQLQMVCKRIK